MLITNPDLGVRQHTKQMVILSEHDWCPWNRLNTHVMFHSFKVLVVKRNKYKR